MKRKIKFREDEIVNSSIESTLYQLLQFNEYTSLINPCKRKVKKDFTITVESKETKKKKYVDIFPIIIPKTKVKLFDKKKVKK